VVHQTVWGIVAGRRPADGAVRVPRPVWI